MLALVEIRHSDLPCLLAAVEVTLVIFTIYCYYYCFKSILLRLDDTGPSSPTVAVILRQRNTSIVVQYTRLDVSTVSMYGVMEYYWRVIVFLLIL